MNRTDELTDRLIDGTLTDAEAVELEALLAADPAAQARHLAAVRLELVLRGLRTEFDLAGPTVARIESDRVERMTAAVMAELANRPPPDPARPARRVRVWAAFGALTAALLVAVWLGLRSPDTPRVPNEPPPATPEFARLTSVSGSVEVVGPAGETAARPNQALTPDQTLRTVGEESVAVVEFPDRTRVEVYPESAVRFGPEPNGEPVRKLLLIQGRITATATSRLVVGAGATEVEASRGSFSLWSAGSGSARVESTDGDVRVSRGGPAEPVVLPPGRAAFVRNEKSPVRIDSPWRIDAEPRARLDFQALDVGFDDAGEVVAVSAKQWARWKPGTPDPGRTPFPPKVFNDGLAAWLTPDRRAVALCRIDDREERIVVRDLPSGAERGQVPVRASDPRFLCVAPDASWVATAGEQKPFKRRIRVWDVQTGAERFSREVNDSVACLAALPDGRGLAVGVSDLGGGTNNAVVTFDAVTGDRLVELQTRRKFITSLTFTSDSRRLAAGFNGAVQIWDIPNRKLLRTLDGFERGVTRLAFSPKGDLLAAGTHDGQVWVWSAATGRRTRVIDTGTRGVRSLAFSADGKFLVTATNKAPVAVWDVSPPPPAGSEPDA
jgi:WD40 repeat protein